MYSGSIISQITVGGRITTEFLAMTPDEWATRQFLARYQVDILPTEIGRHFARRCWEYLTEEYSALRAWFTDDGSLSTMLASRFLDLRLTGPIEDGIGWDFTKNGEPNIQIIQFKAQTIMGLRMLNLVPDVDRNSGNPQFAICFNLLKTAYTARAAAHRWRPTLTGISGADLSRRWVAWKVFNHMLVTGCDPDWAWQASKCLSEFGPTDEDRRALA